MNAYSAAIVAICLIMSVDIARGLECYNCLAATGAAGCQGTTTCSDSNYCYTIKASVLGVSTYSKGCLAACATTSTGSDSTGSKTTCCQTDKCNSSGAVELRSYGPIGSILFIFGSVLFGSL